MADREPDIRLGRFTERAEQYVSCGAFDSINEVVAEALDALDRQKRREDELYTASVREAIAAPGRFLPMEEAFVELDERKRIRHGE